MKAFAVRHKLSKLFIPRLPKGYRRGGTYLEPTNEREPRLFHNRKAAASFLGNWLRGTAKNHSERSGEFGEDVSVYPIYTKQANRKLEDMEIVEFDLKEIIK